MWHSRPRLCRIARDSRGRLSHKLKRASLLKVGNSERAADRVVSGGRIFLQQFGRLLRRDAGGQRIAPVADQSIENLRHRGGRLSFGEDHLGKSAAPRAVEIDLCVAQVGDSPPPGLMDELIERQLSRQQPFGKFSELHIGHSIIVSAAADGVNLPDALLSRLKALAIVEVNPFSPGVHAGCGSEREKRPFPPGVDAGAKRLFLTRSC